MRTAFGRFFGIQAGWFTVLTPLAAAAAQANLFVNYLASFNHELCGGVPRAAVIIALIAVPVGVNLATSIQVGNLASTADAADSTASCCSL